MFRVLPTKCNVQGLNSPLLHAPDCTLGCHLDLFKQIFQFYTSVNIFIKMLTYRNPRCPDSMNKRKAEGSWGPR